MNLQCARRWIAAGGLLGAIVAIAPSAAADDPSKEECITANENADTVKRSGKLQAARKQFQVCLAATCPGPVREDCAAQIAEIDKAIPTVVFVVNDTTGSPIRGVRISLDGAPVPVPSDGSEIEVDPGDHRFELQATGYASTVWKVQVRAGEKRHQEVVVLPSAQPAVAQVASAPPVPKEKPSAAPGRPTDAPEPAIQSPGSGRRTLAYIIGGVGLLGLGAGTYFGLKAKSTYDDAVSLCPNGPSSCSQAGADGGSDAHSQATISTVAFVAGGALVATGLVLFLTAPNGNSMSVRPTAGLGGAGVRLGGTW